MFTLGESVKLYVFDIITMLVMCKGFGPRIRTIATPASVLNMILKTEKKLASNGPATETCNQQFESIEIYHWMIFPNTLRFSIGVCTHW